MMECVILYVSLIWTFVYNPKKFGHPVANLILSCVPFLGY